jgi:hypothetical protein
MVMQQSYSNQLNVRVNNLLCLDFPVRVGELPKDDNERISTDK